MAVEEELGTYLRARRITPVNKDEDTYFPLDEELTAMRDAGFEAECIWHERTIAVVVGRTG